MTIKPKNFSQLNEASENKVKSTLPSSNPSPVTYARCKLAMYGYSTSKNKNIGIFHINNIIATKKKLVHSSGTIMVGNHQVMKCMKFS